LHVSWVTQKKSRVQNPLGLFRYQRIIAQTNVLPVNNLRKHRPTEISSVIFQQEMNHQ